jgi:fructuronate reductase
VHDAWPVVTEAFFDWAVEDRVAADRPAWTHQPGARVVTDAAPWETPMRMVNGAHSTIAYLAVAAGWATSTKRWRNPRFANPALAHKTMQIAMDGSQKLPPRLLGTVRDRLALGQPVTWLAVSIAAWLQHLRGHDDAGRAYAIDDPIATGCRHWRGGCARR